MTISCSNNEDVRCDSFMVLHRFSIWLRTMHIIAMNFCRSHFL
jgi:hypothetical protein